MNKNKCEFCNKEHPLLMKRSRIDSRMMCPNCAAFDAGEFKLLKAAIENEAKNKRIKKQFIDK